MQSFLQVSVGYNRVCCCKGLFVLATPVCFVSAIALAMHVLAFSWPMLLSLYLFTCSLFPLCGCVSIGLYDMWDTLRARHPGLLIDDCSSGGRRIDGETLARSVPLWRSDNPGDSIQQQVQSMGLSAFAPLSSGGVAWIDPYTWRSSGITGKTADWGLAVCYESFTCY